MSTKRYLITDRAGIPLAFVLTGANTHDSLPFEKPLDRVPVVSDKPRQPNKLYADKVHDIRRYCHACRRRRRITTCIARCEVETARR